MSCILFALQGFSATGCNIFENTYFFDHACLDGSDLSLSQCESQWEGDLGLPGGDEINTECVHACRGYVLENFEEAEIACQSVFHLTQSHSNFGTYVQCPICATNYPHPRRQEQ